MRQIFPVQGEELPVLRTPAPGPLPAAVAHVARLYQGEPGAGRWLRANMVASADGAAAVEARSGGLSGPADRMVFTILRSLSDLVLVGAGTAIAEHYRPAHVAGLWPQLRQEGSPPPAIAVVSSQLTIDPDSALLAAAPAAARTIVLTTERAPARKKAALARHARIIEAGGDRVDLPAALAELDRIGYTRILCEGGPALLGELAAEGLIDELCLTTSPLVVGGQAGRIIRTPAGVPGGSAAPARMALAHVLADDSYLLSRYLKVN